MGVATGSSASEAATGVARGSAAVLGVATGRTAISVVVDVELELPAAATWAWPSSLWTSSSRMGVPTITANVRIVAASKNAGRPPSP